MLIHRVRSGVLMGSLVLLAAFFAPPFLAMLLIAGVTGYALLEFFSMLQVGGHPHFKRTGLALGLFLVVETWIGLRFYPEHALVIELASLFAVVVGVLVRQMCEPCSPKGIQAMAMTLLAIFYIAFPINFITMLLLGWDGGMGRALLIYGIVLVKLTDTGAYFVGCRYGRHKLWPKLSPGKTWEGCGGGVAAALVASVLWFLIGRGSLGVVSFGFLDALALGVFLPVAGILGDLAESMIKRSIGVKDSGRGIKGMGGILDVVDSLLFTLPVLYIYAKLFL